MFLIAWTLIKIVLLLLFDRYLKTLNKTVYHGIYKKYDNTIILKPNKYKKDNLKLVQNDIKLYLTYLKNIKYYFKAFTFNILFVPSFIDILGLYFNQYVIIYIKVIYYTFILHLVFFITRNHTLIKELIN
jgi:hypothetical protein